MKEALRPITIGFPAMLAVLLLQIYFGNADRFTKANVMALVMAIGAVFGLFVLGSRLSINEILRKTEKMEKDRKNAELDHGHLCWGYCIKLVRGSNGTPIFEQRFVDAGFRYAVDKYKRDKMAGKMHCASEEKKYILAVLSYFERHQIYFGWVSKEID